MKHTIQAGVVSPFPMALDPEAVEFGEIESAAIAAVYANGGAALWNGEALSFETDVGKTAELLAGFNEAWQSSEIMAKMRIEAEEAEYAQRQSFEELLKAASAPKRRNEEKA